MKVLISKRGHMNISKEEYNKFVEIMVPYFHQKYDNKVLVLYNCEENNGFTEILVKDFKSLEKFNQFSKKKIDFIETSFINKLVDEYKMLDIELDTGNLEVGEIDDCDCCGNLSKGYLKYLKDQKISVFYYLTIHNYNKLSEYFKQSKNLKK